MAFDHHAGDAVIPVGDLRPDFVKHRRLARGVFAAVGMAGIDHDLRPHAVAFAGNAHRIDRGRIKVRGATATAQEPVKIATVDLLKAFDSYWKTKLSNDQLKERGADFDKARIGMIDDLNLLREDYNRLNASTQDQANSEEKRADDQKKAQVKLAEYKRLEQQIIEFNKNAQKTLADQTHRLRKGRLEEIQEVIDAKAKELGYEPEDE